MYDEILIPTDGRSAITEVTERALGIAEPAVARVHALYVVDENAYRTVPADAREHIKSSLENDGHDATRAVAEQVVEAGYEVVTEVRWGAPAVTIISYAVENDIDLIVMGTRGKTGFERYLLGSVAEKVVRLSPMPVLTVHIGDREGLEQEIEELIGV